MITTKTFDELQKMLSKGETKFLNGYIFSDYKLCYIDSIDKTYSDYTPESKAYMETEEYKVKMKALEEEREAILKEHGSVSINIYDWPYNVLKFQDYPNPEYIPCKQTLYAYFTPISLNKQWGDDWDDAPYEYNAEIPYDSYERENGDRIEYEILRVPFYINHDGWNIKMPKDYGPHDYNPFSLRDINSGAVAWIYARGENYYKIGGVSIMAGDNIQMFKSKIDKINELYPFVEDEYNE